MGHCWPTFDKIYFYRDKRIGLKKLVTIFMNFLKIHISFKLYIILPEMTKHQVFEKLYYYMGHCWPTFDKRYFYQHKKICHNFDEFFENTWFLSFKLTQVLGIRNIALG